MIERFKTKNSMGGLNYDLSLGTEEKFRFFTGANGCGKTDLLKSMVQGVLYGHCFFRAKNEGVKFGDLIMQDILYSRLKNMKIALPLHTEINDFILKDEQKERWGFTTLGVARYKKTPLLFDFPLVYLSSRRRGEAVPGDFKKKWDKTSIYEAFLLEFLNMHSAIWTNQDESLTLGDWLLWQLNKQDQVCLEYFWACLEPFELGRYGVQAPPLRCLNNRIYIYGVPLENLSQGTIAIMKIFQNVIASLSAWSAFQKEEVFYELKSLVFIDDLDLYFNEACSEQIVAVLKEKFPQAFFNVTVHNQKDASSAEKKVCYELIREGNEVTIAK